MLLWRLQSSLRKIRTVLGLSCSLHLIACFALLFVYKDYHQRLFVDLSSRIPSQAVVKLLPLSASRPSTVAIGVKGGGKMVSGKRGKKSKAATSLVRPVQRQKKGAGKGAYNKKAKNVLQQKTKQVKAKEKSPAQQLGKAVEPKEEPKSVSVPKPEATKPVEPVVQEALSVANAQAAGVEGQEIVYLTKQELDALQIHQKLQESLFAVWSPPAGMPSEQYCEVSVVIGWDGTVQETKFLKKTGSLVYDLTVQEALEQVGFPHEVWGKHITIAFKPAENI